MSEDFILELARLEREVLERVRLKRMNEQKGELWIDLPIDDEAKDNANG